MIIHKRHRDNLSIKPDDVTSNKTVIFSHLRETFKPHVSIYCQRKQSIPYFFNSLELLVMKDIHTTT